MVRPRRGFLLHLHPPVVPVPAMALNRTWGLGGMALVLFGLLAGTGILLMLVYDPTPGEAYRSVIALQREVPFGGWVRNIHHWSANLLVVVTVLHLLRVVYTGGFLGPRRGNWWVGLGLLAGVLIAVFTGYLLPWDQVAYWAVTICTAMLGYVPGFGDWLQTTVRGGAEVGAPTLRTFYTLHTGLLPLAMLAGLGFHFFKVRRARGVVLPPTADAPATVPACPDLIVREVAVGLGLMAAVLWWAAWIDAPLAAMANPGLTPNPAKAPWYFIGIQELLIHLDPLFAVTVVPLLCGIGLATLPRLADCDDSPPGTWFGSRRGRRLSALAAAAAAVGVPAAIVVDQLFYRAGEALGAIPRAVSGGLLPVGLFVGVLWAGHRLARRRGGGSRLESALAVATFLFVSLAILTATGLWFRGPGMALVWPG